MSAVGLLVQTCIALQAESTQRIDLSDLPEPPAEIASLIRQGDVEFSSGPRAGDEPQSGSRRIVAETHYRLAYRYRSSTRWSVTRRDSQRELVVRVRYSGVRLEPHHRVWFEQQPPRDRFWNDRLVLHELDHVRISSDPRLVRRFESLLREHNTIRRTISPQLVVNERVVRRIVAERVEEIFGEIKALVEIRYRELDRVTDHGGQPIPADSPIQQWLGPPPASSVPAE